MFFEKLYNLIYHIGFTAGSGFMKFGKWLSRGLSRPVKTVGAVFFAVFLVIDKFILKTFKTVSAEFKLLMADIKRVSAGLISSCSLPEADAAVLSLVLACCSASRYSDSFLA